MASNQTPNLKLSQWEADDEVLRVDFNADNVKIDSAVTAAQAAAQTARECAERAYSPDNRPFAAGHYAGDGEVTRVISVGFTPSLVLVAPVDMRFISSGNGYTLFYGGVAVPGYNAASSTRGETEWVDGVTGVMIVEGGFQVGCVNVDKTSVYTNDKSTRYRYIAFR